MGDKEKYIIELLNIYMCIIEANKGIPALDDLRIIDAEGLSLKFFSHSLSILKISRGLNINGLALPINNFPDPYSINVLVRAAFETFLVFYYIFIDSYDSDETNLRYQSWELSALYQRQKFPATLEESIRKLEKEKILIEELEQKIKNNPHFVNFTKKQKNNYFSNLDRSNWRSKSWTLIAQSAGFSELNSKIMYSLLCEHAHSGNISATQVSQVKSFETRIELMEAGLSHLVICIANMIKFYCQYFPKSNEYYQKNFNEPNVVTFWIDIGRDDIS